MQPGSFAFFPRTCVTSKLAHDKSGCVSDGSAKYQLVTLDSQAKRTKLIGDSDLVEAKTDGGKCG